jgi:hypothetical protein
MKMKMMKIAILRNEQMQELVDKLAPECSAGEKLSWAVDELEYDRHIRFSICPCSRSTFVRVL